MGEGEGGVPLIQRVLLVAGILISGTTWPAISQAVTLNPLYLEGCRAGWDQLGERFAYKARCSDPQGNHEIRIGTLDGQPSTKVLNYSGFGDFVPSWSPNGEQIAFSAEPFGGSFPNRLFVVTIADSTVEQVTLGQAEHIDWSPDGRLAFISGSARLVVIEHNGFHNAIDLPGGNPSYIEWSPSGNLIACTTWGTSGTQLVVVDVSAESVIFTLDTPHHEWDPAWSPDGQRLVYISDSLGHQDLHAVNIASGLSVPITDDAAIEESPSWSPLGDAILFVRGNSLWIATDLPTGPVEIQPSSWSRTKAAYR